MSRRLFSVAEVDALIPRLTQLIGAAMERHAQASDLAQRLRDERERIRLAGGGLLDQAEWKARAERLDGLVIEVRAAIESVQQLGGAVKDLGLGLVDFPGLVPAHREDEPVNLCWKYGEDAVRFWHRVDEGYRERKPLP